MSKRKRRGADYTLTTHHADGTETVQNGTGMTTPLDGFRGTGGHIKIHLYPPSSVLPGGRWPSIEEPSGGRN